MQFKKAIFSPAHNQGIEITGSRDKQDYVIAGPRSERELLPLYLAPARRSCNYFLHGVQRSKSS
ncbi:hypothetical protein PUN4_130099 [Paraburkholderia unamae]|nr:hypothetical protein PUN4_130099 [Paraburkholderia unamae]